MRALASPLKWRAMAALAIAAAADALDYAAAPLFSIPLIGDIPDAIVSGIFFSITRSKRSALINMVEFVPFLGDLVSTYTLSTLLWLHRESKKQASP